MHLRFEYDYIDTPFSVSLLFDLFID